jgi:hypothetical protein
LAAPGAHLGLAGVDDDAYAIAIPFDLMAPAVALGRLGDQRRYARLDPGMAAAAKLTIGSLGDFFGDLAMPSAYRTPKQKWRKSYSQVTAVRALIIAGRGWDRIAAGALAILVAGPAN